MARLSSEAATILLLRRPEDPEVLLVHRAPALSFLGNQWAFPGGTVEPEDERLARSIAGEDKLAPFRVAAIRELFEETGFLLGTLRDPGARASLRSATPTAFARAVEEGEVRLALEALLPAGRYLTPEYLLPFQIDARYFLAWLPEEEKNLRPEVSRELCAAEFLRPRDALASWRSAERMLPSPVRVALSNLSLVPARPEDPAAYLTEASCSAEKSRAIDPIDCGDLGGRMIEVFPGVFLVPLRTPTLPPATHTNCVLFGTREMVAVDPASPYPREQKILDNVLAHLASRGASLRAILLTHHHPDHIGGAAYLKAKARVPVYAHPKTAALLPSGLVDRPLEDGEEIELSGDVPRKLKALFTPGHAPGHLCYLEEHTRVAATGDMMASIGTIVIDPKEGDMRQYLDSLRRVKEAEMRFLIPSHGAIIGDPAGKVDQYIKHRLMREEKVLSALQSHSGPALPKDLLASAYDDTPPTLYPLALLSLLSHVEKLVQEGRVLRQHDGRLLLPTDTNARN